VVTAGVPDSSGGTGVDSGFGPRVVIKG
jgi:hypothetical protein